MNRNTAKCKLGEVKEGERKPLVLFFCVRFVLFTSAISYPVHRPSIFFERASKIKLKKIIEG